MPGLQLQLCTTSTPPSTVQPTSSYPTYLHAKSDRNKGIGLTMPITILLLRLRSNSDWHFQSYPLVSVTFFAILSSPKIVELVPLPL